MDRLGITVDPISSQFAQEYKLNSAFRSGVHIATVAGNGPSYRTLYPDQIILGELHPTRRDIKSVDDLAAAVAAVKAGDVLDLKICTPQPDGSCPTNSVGVQIDK